MYKVFVIAMGSLTRTARDKKALALLLLMPMLLIGILGSALKGMMTEGKINPFTVLVINADTPARPPVPAGAAAAAGQLPTFHFGKVLVDQVLNGAEVQKIIKTVPMTDLDDAKKQVANGKAAAAIYVPPAFSAGALAAKPVEIQLFTDPGQPTEAGIVNQVVSAFTDGVTSGILSTRVMNPQQLQQAAAGSISNLGDRGALPQVKEVASGTRDVSAMQYYAAAMAVMFMVMTGLGQAKAMIQDRQEGRLARMLTTPTSKATVLTGYVLGSAILILVQFVVLLVGTRLIYSVYWGDWLPVLLLGVAFACAAAGVGIAAAGVLREPKAADAAVGLIGNLFGALSGAMFPLYLFPNGLRAVAHFIPNYWALQGFLDQMAGTGLSHLWPPVAVLALMGAATGALGTWRLASK